LTQKMYQYYNSFDSEDVPVLQFLYSSTGISPPQNLLEILRLSTLQLRVIKLKLTMKIHSIYALHEEAFRLTNYKRADL